MSNIKGENGGCISRSILTASNQDMTASDWASQGRVIANRDAANNSAFKKRNMTFDAGRDSQLEKRLAASPMPNHPSASPIQVMKQIPGRDGKNDSVFANALLAGSNSGYRMESPTRVAEATQKSDFQHRLDSIVKNKRSSIDGLSGT